MSEGNISALIPHISQCKLTLHVVFFPLTAGRSTLFDELSRRLKAPFGKVGQNLEYLWPFPAADREPLLERSGSGAGIVDTPPKLGQSKKTD